MEKAGSNRRSLKIKFPIKRAVRITIILMMSAFLASLYIFGDAAGYRMLSIYSNLTKGREILLEGVRLKVPSEWYISTSETKIARLVGKNRPIVVAFFENKDVKEFLVGLRSGSKEKMLPNIRVGKYESYSFLFEKPCAGI